MLTAPDDPERGLILSYAPTSVRAGLAAVLALDDRLGGIVRRATDPTIGLMRLTWWGEALAALDVGPPPAEPLLQTLSAAGVRGGPLAGMIDGWALLLDGEPLDASALATFGRERGGHLFGAMASLLNQRDERVEAAGEGWALAGLAGRITDRQVAAAAARMAGERLSRLFDTRWPRSLRTLGAMALLARSDLVGGRRGSPARVGRLLLHRLTGR